MKRASPPEQLQIPFDSENPFPQALRDGRFVVFLDYTVPRAAEPFASAMVPGRRIARTAADRDVVQGLVVSRSADSSPAHDPVEAARILREESGKPVILCISGADVDRDGLAEVSARALSYDIRTVLAVSGDIRGGTASGAEGAAERGGRVRGRRHTDSVEILRFLARHRGGLFRGAVVNPYKYTTSDVFLQYFKMVRKATAGAGFLVAQMGWDMAKAQELQWYLQSRELVTPVLARLHVLAPEESTRLADGLAPGVHVSREFAAMVEREYTLNRNQFLATQLRRTELQARGYALLGYSGLVLHGIRDEDTAVMVLDHVEEGIRNRSNDAYGSWLDEWKSFHDGVPFAPHANAFYCYENLLDPEVRLYEASACRGSNAAFPEARAGDRVRRFLVEGLLTGSRTPAAIRRLLLGLCGRGHFSAEELCASAGLCPAACPKGLAWGPCGGAFPDGTCETGRGECFHHRVLAVRADQRRLDLLETLSAEQP